MTHREIVRRPPVGVDLAGREGIKGRKRGASQNILISTLLTINDSPPVRSFLLRPPGYGGQAHVARRPS